MAGGVRKRIDSGARYAPAVAHRWIAPSKKFVIVTLGRTGSELLVELLDSHPAITCRGELLAEGPRFPRLYVKAQAAAAGLHATQVFGWKLLAAQIRGVPRRNRGQDYLAELHREGYQIVLLERRSYLQQAISWHRAQSTRYHHRRGEHAGFSASLIEPASLLYWARVNEEAAAALRRLVRALPHLVLAYEADLLDPAVHQSTVDRVCTFLAVEPKPVTSRLVKVAPRRTREMLANWDEVAALFTRSGAAHLLGEAE